MSNRKAFQGVINIIRFNWHFYAITAILLFLFLIVKSSLPPSFQFIVSALMILGTLFTINSLFVSVYVYDFSNLYDLKWLPNLSNKNVLNINAGFDETSNILHSKFQNITLTNCDFYNPEKHTEISIKRARKAYPPSSNSIQVSSDKLPFKDDFFDCSIAIFAAHEIRDFEERALFLKEISRVLKPNGEIYITEHLRDINNFLAYSIGFFHFHSKKNWLKLFKNCNLTIIQEVQTTPFITTFILIKNGNPL